MYKVRTYNKISEKGLGLFDSERYNIGEGLESPDAFILRSQKLHDEAFPDSLLAIARAGAGVNNIPIPDCTEKGVVVFNTPGANANAVKELVVAGMLLASRDVYGGMNFVQSLTDMDDAGEMAKRLEAEKKRFAGGEIAGKTLGIVGLGAIGSMVANMGLELGMSVAGFDPALSVEAAWRLSSRVQKVDNLHALLKICDFVSLHIPANEHTRGLVDDEAFAAMKPGGCLINFAREEIVDPEALVKALDEGRLHRYVADFPRPELLGRPEAILMPHIGASTAEAEQNCAVMATRQLMDYLENGNITNSVNFPQTRMGRNGGWRITFANRNVPKVLGSVLSVLADRDINVIDMVNKSRGEIAYNIIDVESEPGPGALEAIAAAEGVIRLRVLPPKA
ncbi:phosphoglycerate dehydrogenase [Marinihelvus fidelis]|uniref:D-3-phosphoglycerate dehydrogenase n=1 Tax=Marinihelvus fidelis TaxID=2613842 RepID=A0A5N0THL0_9GAMM|nr:phosphoglycerate dehydrogenase [Marinihelvus fidelis]KAA9133587.1 phosphoglycerate dehydrogenase [Marinihelvus fidelis]